MYEIFRNDSREYISKQRFKRSAEASILYHVTDKCRTSGTLNFTVMLSAMQLFESVQQGCSLGTLQIAPGLVC